MIWYTYQANENVTQNLFVQLSNDGQNVELHTTGTPVGLCLNVEVTEDTAQRLAQVYANGGSGSHAVLNSAWDGNPSRFDVINGKVEPVASGGMGWLIPAFPKVSYSANDLVRVAIYK